MSYQNGDQRIWNKKGGPYIYCFQSVCRVFSMHGPSMPWRKTRPIAVCVGLPSYAPRNFLQHLKLFLPRLFPHLNRKNSGRAGLGRTVFQVLQVDCSVHLRPCIIFIVNIIGARCIKVDPFDVLLSPDAPHSASIRWITECSGKKLRGESKEEKKRNFHPVG